MEQIIISQEENQRIQINSNEPQLINISNIPSQNINLNQELNQELEINQPQNQVILIGQAGNIIGISDVLVNGVSVVSGNIAYVIVPTKTSELTNDSGYITINDIPEETDPTVPSYVKAISLADINRWNNKQNELVSGSTIKTINNISLLGNGNINLEGSTYTAGYGIDIDSNNEISNTITSYNDLSDLPTIPTSTSQLTNNSNFVSSNELSEVAFTGNYNALSGIPQIPANTSELINDGDDGLHPFISKEVNDLTNYTTTTNLNTLLSGKQDTLVSGTNIKTINNNSILGSGNLTISGGTSTDVQINGTSITSGGVANIITETAYNSSTNKIATVSDIPTNTSDLQNDSGFITSTDYGTFSTGGTVKSSNGFMINSSTGNPYANTYNYNEYNSHTNEVFIGKGTLENALTGKGYITNSVNNLTNYTNNTDLATTLSNYGKIKVLWTGWSNGQVTLNDNISNYDYLIIFYGSGTYIGSVTVTTGVNNSIILTYNEYDSNLYINIFTTICSLGTNTITPTKYYYTTMHSNFYYTSDSSNYISLYKVIGIKGGA